MQAQQETLQLLQQVQSGQLRPEEALLQLKLAPFEDLGYAKIDSHRPIRQGAAEVIYGAGKTPEEILGILQRMTGDGGQNILVTRMAPEAAELVQTQLPLDYHPLSKVGIAAPTERPQVGNIVIVTGGTSDIPVAEEAALTAQVLGSRVTCLYDVGVSGLHRTLAHLDVIMSARVLIVASPAWKGRWPALSAGWQTVQSSPCPPAWGMAPALAGLPPCWPCSTPAPSGVSVVNIDNGFGAGYQAFDDQSDEGDLRR